MVKEGTVTKQRRRKGATGGHQTVQKPLGIDQYNAYMGGVDKSDQLVTYYDYNNFSRKWWKRVYLFSPVRCDTCECICPLLQNLRGQSFVSHGFQNRSGEGPHRS